MTPTFQVSVCVLTIALTCLTQAIEDVCRGKASGLYADPSDCKAFFQCAWGRTYKQRCPASLNFNAAANACDYTACTPSGSTGPRQMTTMPPVTSSSESSSNNGGSCKRIVCYFTSWAQYRQGNAKQQPKDLDGRLCTHIIHSFANIKNHKLVDYEWNDPQLIKGLVQLKNQNSDLKILVAVGGWKQASFGFSPMVSTKATRNIFIDSAVRYLKQHKLDGLDLDWEYPAHRGSPVGDKNRFSDLLRELRARFNQEGFLLTAAVGAPAKIAQNAYDIPVLSETLDFINLMSYDYYGGWNTDLVPRHHSALEGPNEITTKSATDFWIQSGASKDKLVIGVPLYGRTMTLSGGRISGGGNAGPQVRLSGFLSYFEVCLARQKGGISQDNTNPMTGPNFRQGNQWIGYDDRQTVAAKTNFAKNYGGVMVWDLAFDDFSGAFCNQGKFPLMHEINNKCNA